MQSKTTKFDIINIAVLSYALYAVKCVWLAFDSLDYLPAFYYIMRIPLALCLLFGFLIIFKRQHRVKNYWLLILPFVYFSYNMFHSYAEWDFIQDVFTVIIITFFIQFSANLKIRIFDAFYWIIQVCNIISLVVMLLYILNIDIGFQTVPYYSTRQNADYIKWFIFAIYRNPTQIRLCGIFNEPGGLGTVCSLLFAARFQYSRRWEKAILIVTILFTYSMAGYAIIMIYIFLYTTRKMGVGYGAATVILSMAAIYIMFSVIPNIRTGTGDINRLIRRFAMTASGLAGDNRTTAEFNNIYESFTRSARCLLGYGAGYPLPSGSLTYKTYILEYGFIGFGLWIFVWIKAAVKEIQRDKYGILFLLLFLLSLYQRPRLLESIYGYVLLFGGIEWILWKGQLDMSKVKKDDPL